MAQRARDGKAASWWKPAVSLAIVVGVAAGVTAVIDELLLTRVRAGTDNSLRLAAILPYVGIDDSYTLARALGITALIFAYGSVLLGLVTAGRRARYRPVNPLTSTLHRQIGVLTLALVAAHAAVPFASAYTPYGGLATQFLPFGQPWQWGTRATNSESLGILAFYLGVLTGPTFYLAGRLRRGWLVLHRVTVAVYVLSVLHTFFLGTDFLVSGPARVTILAAQIPLIVLSVRRLHVAAGPRRTARWAATGAGMAGCAVLAALTVLVATGTYAGGMQL